MKLTNKTNPFKTLCRIALLAIVATNAIAVSAQNGVMSPYSRFGYGFLSDNATAAQRTLGGTGYAMNSGRQINIMNPASYAAMDSLTFLFDMGMDLTAVWSSQGTQRESNFGSGLDYITMQVPLGRYMGASLGLLPFSSVGYSFGSTIDNGSLSHSGSGSINELNLGIAGRPFRGFTIGANIAYVFGSIVNDVYAASEYGTSTLFERSMSVRDYRLDFGAQYSFNIKRDHRVTLGLVYAPQKDMHGKVYGIYYDMTADNVVPDTVPGSHSMAGHYSTPEKWGAGINYQFENKLMVEADFTYEPWSKAKFGVIEDFERTTFANRYRFGVGAQLTPDWRGNYVKRIQYRFGAFYNRDYVMVGSNNIRDFGVSLGAGLPVPGFKTVISIGLEYRHRQAYPVALVKEDYLNITIGVNFNEMWFRKNRLY
ncbi:MAG: hypothetical protein J1F20_07085 [Muribaculaceae bacterium]|nr:hypothetical protein [Muribaculaceae bacterium]